jgi:tetratricopeptide (TPR) repeat protein
VAFKRYFANCEAAESCVHSLLESKGFRIASNREFFRAPIEEVVYVIQSVPEHIATPDGEGNAACSPVSTDGPAWQVALNEGFCYYLGVGDSLQDYSEALKLFKQAAKFGSPSACWWLGVMHLHGDGCSANKVAALEWFKEGARRGEFKCYAEMAEAYFEEGQVENARKCWTRFLEGLRPDDTMAASGCYNYLRRCMAGVFPLEYLERMRPLLTAIRSQAREHVSSAAEASENPWAVAILSSEYRSIAREIDRLFGVT